IDGAMGVLVHFDIHPDYPIMEIGEAMSIVEESADEDASVIFGTTTNPDMAIDEVKITIIATGFEDKNAIPDPSAKPATQKTLINSNSTANTINTMAGTRRMAVGSDYENEDILDVPTFLRKQMD
ncbi:MAG TPA: cell division protein FtsZ, partial [Epsilonproteobacteria bacterium]|nr:cell division protein FtsZ [Campylobacterota bacterium]